MGLSESRCSNRCMQGNDVALVEPFVDATEVSVAVLETENGPIALLPTEIQLFDISHVMIDADLDLQHHIDRNEVAASLIVLT